jgi:sn-glycerol 3-phosphate transport system substrate-binding protein
VPSTSTTATSTTSAGSACPPAGAGGEAVTLRLWNAVGSAVAGVVDAAVARYEADHPLVDVQVVEGQGAEELAAGVDPAERPAVVIDDVADLAPLAAAGAVVPIEPCLAAQGLPVPELLPVLRGRMERTPGQLWGLPFAVSTPVVVYDRDRLRAAGLDPDDPPDTPAELAEAADAVVQAGAAATGLAFDPSQSHWFVEHWRSLRGLLTVDDDNGWSGTAERPLFGDVVTLGDLEYLAGLLGRGAAVMVPASPNAVDALARLRSPEQPAAMALTSSGSLRDLRQLLDDGTVQGDFAATRLPAPGPGAVPGGAAAYVTSGLSGAETAAAVELASTLTDRTTLQALVAATSYVPVWPDAGTDPAVAAVWERYPERRVPYDALAAVEDGPTTRGVLLRQYAELRSVERSLVEAIAAGADPATALVAAEEAAAEILDA